MKAKEQRQMNGACQGMETSDETQAERRGNVEKGGKEKKEEKEIKQRNRRK